RLDLLPNFRDRELLGFRAAQDLAAPAVVHRLESLRQRIDVGERGVARHRELRVLADRVVDGIGLGVGRALLVVATTDHQDHGQEARARYAHSSIISKNRKQRSSLDASCWCRWPCAYVIAAAMRAVSV